MSENDGGNPALHRDPAVIAASNAALVEMKSLSKALLYAAILTDDGFEVARVPDRGAGATDDRLASMSSSVQALGDAVARELDMGTGDAVVLSSENGNVIQRRIPASRLILAALFDHDETLGTALSISRVVSERLSGSL